MAITYDVLTKGEQRDIVRESLRSAEREYFVLDVSGAEKSPDLEKRVTDLQAKLKSLKDSQ